jgi:hypothetical protein
MNWARMSGCQTAHANHGSIEDLDILEILFVCLLAGQNRHATFRIPKQILMGQNPPT